MQPRIEDHFCPAFYRKTRAGRFEVFVLDAENHRYNSLGTFEHEDTADKLMTARTAAYVNVRRALGYIE